MREKGSEMGMSTTENVINDLNTAKFILGNTQITLTRELRIRIGQAINSAIDLLEEQKPVEPIDIINEKYPVGDSNRYKGYRCGKCQEIISWDANYCPYCGRKVKWECAN